MALFGRNKNKKTDTLILYGSKSGNAKKVAQLAHKYLQKNGLAVSRINLKKYSPENLRQVHHLLMVVSTHGEGDPPPAAEAFFKEILSNNMSSLAHLQYSVCALGDSSYQMFCEAGRKIDKRLKELKARPFYPLAECDADFSANAIDWIKGSYQRLNGNSKSNRNEVITDVALSKTTYHARITGKQLLSANNIEQPCYHINLKTDNEHFNYIPGDSIEIMPENPAWLVEKILDATGSERDNQIDSNTTIAQKLLNELEITSLSESTLKKYHEKVKNNHLALLLQTPEKLSAYLACANVLDLITDFKPASFPASDLEEILPRIRYRQYSIASAPIDTSSLDLTIKPVKYFYNEIWHEGAASNYFCRTLDIGASVAFRFCRNPDFYLPKDNKVPVIMIANGTGLAPFRAFLQHWEAEGIKGNTWLIFGEKNRSTDFYYADEIHAFQQNKVLEKLDLAFSRDGAQKYYVQYVIMKKREEFMRWLQNGAHIYVCGSLKMGKCVRETINTILSNETIAKISDVKDLLALNRYHEDVY